MQKGDSAKALSIQGKGDLYIDTKDTRYEGYWSLMGSYLEAK